MTSFDQFNWATSTAEEQLIYARQATEQDLQELVRRYDWRTFPEHVLGWVMAQKAIDLGSALTAFFAGEPERFNYLPKRDIPQKYNGIARVLDNICLRVNSGFYLSNPRSQVEQVKRLKNWLIYQEEDRQENRRGRWILDERILDTLKEDALKPDPGAPSAPQPHQCGVWRDMLSPVAELGVSREHLKYLPKEYWPD